jgi:hypothetical protein
MGEHKPAGLKWLALRLFLAMYDRYPARRAPDLVIGRDNPDGAYMLRWYLTPWRGWFQDVPAAAMKLWQRAVLAVVRRLPNLYMHQFLRDDDDRALHDHPSWAISFILCGRYIEHTIDAGGIHRRRVFSTGSLRFMRTRHAHRIELHRESSGKSEPCFTLFLFGPRVRDWGFHCPERGWVRWQDFTAADDSGAIGKGCDA